MDKQVEMDLWRQYRNKRSLDTRNSLIEEYMPMVHRMADIVHKQGGRWIERDELVQAGSLALIERVETYDPGRGCAFGTWAYQRIRGEMQSLVRREMQRSGRERRLNDRDALTTEQKDDALLLSPRVDGNGERIDELCRGLSVTESTIVCLIFRYAMSVGNVAMTLGVSVSQIQRTYQRALAKLRTLRQEEWANDEL